MTPHPCRRRHNSNIVARLRDNDGLPSGIYFYRLQAGDYVETKRMVVVK